LIPKYILFAFKHRFCHSSAKFSRISIILLLFLLISSSFAFSYNHYPPASNWHQGDTNGTYSTSIGASRITLTVSSSGARNYVVSTTALAPHTINLANVSYIAVEWDATYDAATTANVQFGISTVEMDNSFTDSITHTTTFGRQKQILNVSNYTGNYYLKMGTTITGGFIATITMHMYSVELFEYPDVYTINATSVSATSATLNGYLVDDSNLSVNCGFWLSNLSTNATNFLQNISAGSFSAGAYYYSASNLVPGNLHFIRAWANTPYAFNISGNETTFFTLPNPPSDLTATCTSPTSLDLTWTNSTVGNHTNQSVYIRYSTGPHPTTRSEGTFLCNESNWSNYTVTGLEENTRYNFTAWTYANITGSPSFAAWSDGFETASGETEGGTYNIIVLYENESVTLQNLPVDLSIWGKHRFNIHYANLTDWIEFDDGICTSSVNGFFDNNASGNFTFWTEIDLEYVEFLWNYSNGSIYQCSRTIVPLIGEKNITFYIRTNLPVWGISSTYLNDSLVPFLYSIKDPTMIFQQANELDAYLDIYKFNSSGIRMTIHRQFLDAQNKIYPELIGCSKYFIGAGLLSDATKNIDRIGVAPTPCTSSTDATPDPIEIPVSDDIAYSFFDVININQGWRGNEINGFYVYYYDTLFATNSVTFRVWDANGTMVYNDSSTSDIKNFTFALACKLYQYNYTITVDHEIWDSNKTLEGLLYPGMETITDIASLNDFLNKTLGYTPFINLETGQEIPWSWVIVFMLGFILLVSFGKVNGYLGMIGSGAFFAVAYSLVAGMPLLFLIGGVLLITMSIIFALGGTS